MAQLIVRKLEAKWVNRLKRRAKEHGVSMEEEHRRLLKSALEVEKEVKPKMTLLEHLTTMPNVGKDSDFDIPRGSAKKSIKRKGQAARKHLSIQEEMRQKSQELAKKPFSKMNFKELLLSVPDFGDDFDRERKKWKFREIDFD